MQKPNCSNFSLQRRAVLALPFIPLSAGSSDAKADTALSCPSNARSIGKLAQMFEQKAEIRSIFVGSGTFQVGGSKMLEYPDWMLGEWDFSDAILRGVSNPFGMKVVSRTTPGVTKNSMIAAMPDVGASLKDDFTLTFRQRFVRDPANPNLIVDDRPYNLSSLVAGFMGQPTVESVEYAPSKDPTRVSIVYRTPRRDREGSYDLRKAEIFLNARATECGLSGGDPVYITAESMRQVDQASRSGFTYDYLNLRFYRRVGEGTLEVSHRVAAFNSPTDPKYFETLDRAVALYDYSYLAKRVAV